MEKYFRKQEGELVNIVDHTLEQLEKWPNLKIYIGSDSQTYSGITRYVTCLVFRYGQRGAHYIFNVEEVPKVKDDFLRLYNEGVRTLEAHDMLTSEVSVAIEALEFDYAGIKKTISSALVGVFKGYLNATFKGGEMVSTKAADHVCRNYREIRHKWKKDDNENKLRVA